MKLNKFVLGILSVAAVFATACEKEVPKEPDTTPAALKSFAFLASDNAEILTKDVIVEEVAEKMVVRIPGGGKGVTLVATVEADENNEITVNEEKVPASGKVTVDASFPIDIVCKNTNSGLSAAYEVKVGKVLETVMTKIGEYHHVGAKSMDKDFKLLMVNDAPFIVYDRKDTTDAVAGKYSNTAVVVYKDGAFTKAYDGIGVNTTAHAYPVSAAVAADGTPYILYKGGESGSTSQVTLKKLSGSAWEKVGAADFTTQKFSFSFGNPQLFLDGNYAGFFACGNDKTITTTYRMNAGYLWNGSDWANPSLSLPSYGAKGGSDGMFYVAAPLTTKDGLYLITSCNLYGHYMYKFNAGSFEQVVENFLPTGEEYGIPTNLCPVTNADGEIYFLASHSKNPALQVYKFDAEKKTFAEYANKLAATAGSSGSVAEKMAIGINPVTGLMVGVKDDAEGKPSFSFVDNGKWVDFVKVCDEVTYTRYDIAFDSKGNGYCVTVRKDTGDIMLFAIGLEEDILPE